MVPRGSNKARRGMAAAPGQWQAAVPGRLAHSPKRPLHKKLALPCRQERRARGELGAEGNNRHEGALSCEKVSDISSRNLPAASICRQASAAFPWHPKPGYTSFWHRNFALTSAPKDISEPAARFGYPPDQAAGMLGGHKAGTAFHISVPCRECTGFSGGCCRCRPTCLHPQAPSNEITPAPEFGSGRAARARRRWPPCPAASSPQVRAHRP